MKKSIIALLLVSCMILTACGDVEDASAAADENVEEVSVDEEPVEEVVEEPEEVAEEVVEEVAEEEYVPKLPTPDDALTLEAEFPDNQGVILKYPETLYGAQVEKSNAFRFIALDCAYSDDPWATIQVSLDPITSDYDRFMEDGKMVARRAMEILCDHLIEKHYDLDQIVKLVDNYGFTDGKTYWEFQKGLVLDGSNLEAMEGQEVCQHDYLGSVINVRYYGKEGYVLTTIVTAVDKDVNNYYDIATKMKDSINLNYNWSTKSKLVPNKPKKVGKKKSSVVAGSDAGDYGDVYNWEDTDGNIWHFNGYEDEYMGDCTEYLVDDDGYIVNASDPGDTYFDDDDYTEFEWD